MLSTGISQISHWHLQAAEWASWMENFAFSRHEVLREAARDAPKLSRDTVKAVRKEAFERRRKEELYS